MTTNDPWMTPVFPPLTGRLRPSLLAFLPRCSPPSLRASPRAMQVGNLASEAVDPRADETKAILKAEDAFGRLLPHLFSNDWTTLVYALGAVQVRSKDLQ